MKNLTVSSLFILKKKTHELDYFTIDSRIEKIEYPRSIKFSVSDEITFNSDVNIAVFDYDKIIFPLIIRKWKKGDFFYPLGMNGKKKLSDFFIDNKLSVFDKEDCWLLCSGNKISWVIGHRMDERFKISENSKKAYIAKLF